MYNFVSSFPNYRYVGVFLRRSKQSKVILRKLGVDRLSRAEIHSRMES